MNSSENADIPSDLEYSNMPNNGRMSDEMSDRLPIAERIREAFMDGAFTYEWSLENGEVFDRWLASVKAEAWGEGARWAAVECRALEAEDEPWLTPSDNPYREETE